MTIENSSETPFSAHGIAFAISVSNAIIMKKLMFILLMLPAAAGLCAESVKAPVSILSTKRDVVYLKVDKKFLGAVIEVYSAKGDIIFTSEITHRKAIVDFYFEEPGTYSIKFRKGDIVEEFTYVKTSESARVPMEVESFNASIILAQ